MNYLHQLMTKPKMQWTFIDELAVVGITVAVLLVGAIGFYYYEEWKERKKSNDRTRTRHGS